MSTQMLQMLPPLRKEYKAEGANPALPSKPKIRLLLLLHLRKFNLHNDAAVDEKEDEGMLHILWTGNIFPPTKSGKRKVF